MILLTRLWWKVLRRHIKVKTSVFNYAVSEPPPWKTTMWGFHVYCISTNFKQNPKSCCDTRQTLVSERRQKVSENTVALCGPAGLALRSEQNPLLPPAANLGTANPERSCLGPGSLVCVPVHTCMLWSFICRSPSIAAMFPEPGHLQQLKMPLQLAGSAGRWSTLHYIVKRACFASGCKRGSGFNPRSAFSPSFAPQCSHSGRDLWSAE